MSVSISGNKTKGSEYKKLVEQIYKSNKEFGNYVKNKMNANVDPICQKDEKYNIKSSTRKKALAQGYNERMLEKKEKPHKKFIQPRPNFVFGMNANPPTEEKLHVRCYPKVNNPKSSRTNENRKHIRIFQNSENVNQCLNYKERNAETSHDMTFTVSFLFFISLEKEIYSTKKYYGYSYDATSFW